jgi:hypothetical protein
VRRIISMVIIAVLVGVVVTAVPDLKRYFKMSEM